MNIAVHQTSDISSPIIHTGELFFTDPWTNIIAMSNTYNQNTNTRIMDAQDPDYATANSNGNNAIIRCVPLAKVSLERTDSRSLA